MEKRATKKKPAVRTRSFPCPDDLWAEVEEFARARDLGAPAAAARLLLRAGLEVEGRAREFEAARAWQEKTAIASMRKIDWAKPGKLYDWSDIERVIEHARAVGRARRARQGEAKK